MQLIKYFFLRPKAHSGIVQFSVLFCFILFCFVFIGNIYKYLKTIFWCCAGINFSYKNFINFH